ncbi:neuronal acetylcholine receptor subunit alpha-9-like [Amphiura filiformis]|uniref:neuronal acetylcholine receptor subunit alpha-9-like n=1 Tax=Amphiura filiformis TaxID=82378 RepID=UPI003B21E10E
MRQVWKDEYLTWNKMNYDGKDKIVIPSEMIWLPDIILYNSVEDPGDNAEKSTHVMVYSDGTIRWSQPATLRFACLMRLTAFPFDQQDCGLRFGSWSFDGSLIDLHVAQRDGDEAWDVNSEYHENGEWQLTAVTAYRKVTNYTIPANASDPTDSELFFWPEVFFKMKLQRKYNFYLFTLLIPYFLISGLSSLVFFLQPESGEKMSLAITTLLSLVVFNEYVMNIVPPSADFFPLLSEYFLIMIIWVGMCVVLSAWVLHIYHQDADCSRMGPWLRVIIFAFLARAVGMYDEQENEKRNTFSFDELFSGNEELDEAQGQFSLENGPRRMVNPTDDENTNTTVGFSGSYRLEVEVYKIRKYLLAQKDEEKKKEVQEAALTEWRNAAKIVDRFFFWVYSLCNIGLALFFTLKSLDSSGKNIEDEY